MVLEQFSKDRFTYYALSHPQCGMFFTAPLYKRCTLNEPWVQKGCIIRALMAPYPDQSSYYSLRSLPSSSQRRHWFWHLSKQHGSKEQVLLKVVLADAHRPKLQQISTADTARWLQPIFKGAVTQENNTNVVACHATLIMSCGLLAANVESNQSTGREKYTVCATLFTP